MENENPESGKSNPATVEQFQAEFQSLMERYRHLFLGSSSSGSSSASDSQNEKKDKPE